MQKQKIGGQEAVPNEATTPACARVVFRCVVCAASSFAVDRMHGADGFAAAEDMWPKEHQCRLVVRPILTRTQIK